MIMNLQVSLKGREFINQLINCQFLKKVYWVFGLGPSSGILGTRKHNISETDAISKILFSSF
jgi:hypothetical protein